jgi:tetratricopeptide (TPR) repeat protein
LFEAGVLYEQQRLDEAAVIAEEAERTFAHLGDKRRIDALFLRASIKYEARALDAAVLLFEQIIEYAQDVSDIQWDGRGAHALGVVEVDRGNLSAASVHLHRALVIFREIGQEPFRVATEWGLARLVLRSGKIHEAIRRLRDVAAEFEKHGIVTDAALVRLEIADAWLASGEPQQVVEIASHIFSVFVEAGMMSSALSAIAYLREAAAARRVSADDIEAVRRFIKRAERHPSLQFVPPPQPPD